MSNLTVRREFPIFFHIAGDEIFVKPVKLLYIVCVENNFLRRQVRSDAVGFGAFSENGYVFRDAPSDEDLSGRSVDFLRDGADGGVTERPSFAGAEDAVRSEVDPEGLADLAQFLAREVDVHFALIDGGFDLGVLQHIGE